MVKLMVKDGALVCRYVKLLVEFFYGHQAQVQAAEAAARFAQEWGRVEIGKDTKGRWKCAVYQRLVRERAPKMSRWRCSNDARSRPKRSQKRNSVLLCRPLLVGSIWKGPRLKIS